jgi:hypothetical protein
MASAHAWMATAFSSQRRAFSWMENAFCSQKKAAASALNPLECNELAEDDRPRAKAPVHAIAQSTPWGLGHTTVGSAPMKPIRPNRALPLPLSLGR